MANREVHTTDGDHLLWAVQCLSALPASFLAALGALVLYGRARLGGWPVAHINDPWEVGVSYMIFYLRREMRSGQLHRMALRLIPTGCR